MPDERFWLTKDRNTFLHSRIVRPPQNGSFLLLKKIVFYRSLLCYRSCYATEVVISVRGGRLVQNMINIVYIYIITDDRI